VLVAGAGGPKQHGKARFTVAVNGREAAQGQVTEGDADVLQQFDLTEPLRPGPNLVTVEVRGETNLLYQVVARHFERHAAGPPVAKPVLEVEMGYDRTRLTTDDVLRAKATVKYNGNQPACMVSVGLPVPPGLTVDAGEFAELVGAKRVQKSGVSARQVTLYLSDVRPGSAQAFEYALRPKYPVKAKAPAAVAYECHTPASRAAGTAPRAGMPRRRPGSPPSTTGVQDPGLPAGPGAGNGAARSGNGAARTASAPTG
jgi:hypothetical protein